VVPDAASWEGRDANGREGVHGPKGAPCGHGRRIGQTDTVLDEADSAFLKAQLSNDEGKEFGHPSSFERPLKSHTEAHKHSLATMAPGGDDDDAQDEEMSARLLALRDRLSQVSSFTVTHKLTKSERRFFPT
jgi:hypothetical protein